MDNNITDEELVKKIKIDGDKEAIRLLLFRYEGECRKLVYSRLKQMHYRYYDVDEFMQVVRLTTVSIIRTYNAEKGSFHGYWSCAINRVITSEIRRLNSKRRTMEVAQSTLLKEDFNGDVLENMPGDSILLTRQIEVEDALAEIEEIKKRYLSDVEKIILSYRLAGYTYKEIAKIIKSTPKRVDNIMNGVRKKIKKHML